jgi:signal transduction histidine kinase
MASATSSQSHRLLGLARIEFQLREALQERAVPLLVLRLPELERIAWRSGKRAAQKIERASAAAFLRACAQALRRGDRAAHDRGADVFVIAMIAPSRDRATPLPVDVRAVLERVAAAVSLQCDVRVETGWTMLGRPKTNLSLPHEIGIALERGAHERERYEFFAAVGHELRTPLAAIRGYLETVLDGDVDAATARRFLSIAKREAFRMGRLLDGMFDFSLLDLSAAASGACDLTHQVSAACEVVRPLARGRAISLHHEGSVPAVVFMDPDACLQMLVNLLENAVKYGRPGGAVHVASMRHGAEMIVRIDDDGPGIDAEERESVFALRVRGSSAGTRPGTGIGLAIVKMIVQRAGGNIRVTESPMGGARFELALPAKNESAPAAS